MRNEWQSFYGLFVGGNGLTLCNCCDTLIIYKCVCAEGGVVGHACRCTSECVCVCVRARALLAVIELLLGSVLKVGFYIRMEC